MTVTIPPRDPMRYRSYICAVCERDYLYPAYGGYRICNDCTIGYEDRERKNRSKSQQQHSPKP